MLDNESWILTLTFQKVSDELVYEASGVARWLAVNIELAAHLVEEFPSFFGGDVLGQGLSSFGFELIHHRNSSPWRCKVNLKELVRILEPFWMVLDNVASCDFLDHC